MAPCSLPASRAIDNRVMAEVGGNLNLTSVQDTSRSEARR
ncbi:hemagglutinin repeat-containing protein [Burkholderia sp. AU32262]|nr:hemagglutinin repeat-containing protein [Burkholderia sp. AU32262]